jgi:Mg2+ and Co2+ transporter CorA
VVIGWYLLRAGVLRSQPPPTSLPSADLQGLGESWFDVRDVEPDQLRSFLQPLDLHPLALERCVAPTNMPGAIFFGPTVLLEFPASFEPDAAAPTYVTIMLHGTVLVTIRRGPLPELDAVARGLTADGAPPIPHLARIVYEIVDALADSRVRAGIELRDRLQRMSRATDERPGAVTAADLRQLHWHVGALVTLIENQLYCIAALEASDSAALREPHQKAYVQDLVSELELAQRGVYRLEARVNDLDSALQLASSSRVERRLRALTIISAVTLPLGLIAGLLGMNVGGVPGIGSPDGFWIVVGLMGAIVAAELLYFGRAGWFE